MIETQEYRNALVVRMAHGKANTLDLEFCRAFVAEIERLERAGAPAFILTGRDSVFSAGVDLRRVIEGGGPYVREFLPVMSRAFEALFLYRGPVVAAINGHAIAGGCILACGADRRLIARGPGRIGVPELLVGVPFPASVIEMVRFVAAPERFAELVYGGATFSNEEACSRGLADCVVDGGDLMDQALSALERLTAVPRRSFELAKRQLRNPALQQWHMTAGALDREVVEAWAAPETLAAVRAYVAKTLKK
jgi:enoyl-CoA hydratase